MGYLAFKQAQLKADQTKLASDVNGHMTQMLAEKDKLIKVTGEAELAKGKIEGAEKQKTDQLIKKATEQP